MRTRPNSHAENVSAETSKPGDPLDFRRKAPRPFGERGWGEGSSSTFHRPFLLKRRFNGNVDFATGLSRSKGAYMDYGMAVDGMLVME